MFSSILLICFASILKKEVKNSINDWRVRRLDLCDLKFATRRLEKLHFKLRKRFCRKSRQQSSGITLQPGYCWFLFNCRSIRRTTALVSAWFLSSRNMFIISVLFHGREEVFQTFVVSRYPGLQGTETQFMLLRLTLHRIKLVLVALRELHTLLYNRFKESIRLFLRSR